MLLLTTLALAAGHLATAATVDVNRPIPTPTKAKASVPVAPRPRTTLTFDYGWKFHLGDPAGVVPELTAAAVDPSFTRNVSDMDCTFLASRPGLRCSLSLASRPSAWRGGRLWPRPRRTSTILARFSLRPALCTLHPRLCCRGTPGRTPPWPWRLPVAAVPAPPPLDLVAWNGPVVAALDVYGGTAQTRQLAATCQRRARVVPPTLALATPARTTHAPRQAYASRRPVLEDCRGICSTTPGCLVWQYGVHGDVAQGVNSCFIHDPALGARPVCTKRAPHKPPAHCVAPRCFTTMHGESRAAVPPPLQQRPGVAFKEPAFDDSSWCVGRALPSHTLRPQPPRR